MDTLKVNLDSLSDEQKKYLVHIDSIATLIDSQSIFKKSKAGKMTMDNIETEVRYDGFCEEEGGEINKAIGYARDSNRKFVFKYYYLNGLLIKYVIEILDHDPLCSIMYFDGNKVYKPKGISLNQATSVKAQSILFLNFFKK